MNFASKKVYTRSPANRSPAVVLETRGEGLADSSDEEIDDDEFNQGLMAHVSPMYVPVSAQAPPPPANNPGMMGGIRSLLGMPETTPAAAAVGGRAPPAPRKVQRVKKANTNVLSLSLGTLADKAVASGDPIFCTECSAGLSVLSKPVSEGDSMTWTCEFCATPNVLQHMEPEELPTHDTHDYILYAQPGLSSSRLAGTAKDVVIFCVDTSGSMCVTTEVDGSFVLKGHEARRKAFEQLMDPADRAHQARQPKPKKTYVSRLQCVQAAIDAQITSILEHSPESFVLLVTFGSDVTIWGDGLQTPSVLAGDHLSDYNYCMTAGATFQLGKNISSSAQALSNKVFELEENGATALGPAMVISLGLASQFSGSKQVLLCTDGLANVGIGSMDGLKTDQAREACAAFYEAAGQTAVQNAILVSTVTIAGNDCKMENLGQIADLSGGKVDIVSPVDLTKNFSSILAEPVVATHVGVTFLVHHGLKFVNEDIVSIDGFKATRDIGNVTANTDITFEYAVKTSAEMANLNEIRQTRAQSPQSSAGASSSSSAAPKAAPTPQPSPALPEQLPEQLPFQVQIRFTRLDGMQCVRLISKMQETTARRAEAEADVDIAVLGLNSIQKTSAMAAKGDYEGARAYGWGNAKMLSRQPQPPPTSSAEPSASSPGYSPMAVNFLQQQAQLETHMMRAQATETDRRAPRSAAARKETRDDAASTSIFQGKKASLSALKK